MGYKMTHVYEVKKRIDTGELVETIKGQGWPRKFVVPSVSSGQKKPTFKSLPKWDPMQSSANLHIIVIWVGFVPYLYKALMHFTLYIILMKLEWNCKRLYDGFLI